MGPYTCTHENCGKRTDNDSHLCDEHDYLAHGHDAHELSAEMRVKHDAEDAEEPKPFRLPRDFYAYEDFCDRRDYREEGK